LQQPSIARINSCGKLIWLVLLAIKGTFTFTLKKSLKYAAKVLAIQIRLSAFKECDESLRKFTHL
jgi:hypothetical protein